MGYSPEAYEKAERILSERRRSAKDRLSKRMLEIYTKIPEIKELDESITALGIELTRNFLAKSGTDTDTVKVTEKQLSDLETRKNKLIAENGFAPDYLSAPYICKDCHDTGYQAGIMCECFKKLLSQYDVSEFSNTPVFVFENFRLDVYSNEIIPQYGTSPRDQMTEILNYCRNYVEAFSVNSDNVLMYGGAGLGKTFLCNCIANELSAKGFNVILSSAYNIFEIVSKNKFNYKADFTNAINRYYNCDLLIMDDLGTEFVTEYTVSSLFDIINHRLTEGKPTIINANLSLRDIGERYSDRIVSRLLTFTHLLFLGTDIRTMNL